jgi:thymidylate synthase (FAD)
MYPEVEIVGLSLPVEVSDEGKIRVRDDLEGFLADRLIADAGRTCYQTNEKATAEKDLLLIKNMAKSGHTSVFEHANITIRIRGGSRSFTHQLVRHRHQAISQESQRYCDEGSFGFVIPPSIEEAGLEDLYKQKIQQAQQAYLLLQDKLNEAKKAGKLSKDRKTNEDARFILPNAVQSEIVITPNFTELRNMFVKRLTSHAQWEIFGVFEIILKKVVKISDVFDDINEYFQANGNLDTFKLVA